jgi:hypothetical protein
MVKQEDIGVYDSNYTRLETEDAKWVRRQEEPNPGRVGLAEAPLLQSPVLLTPYLNQRIPFKFLLCHSLLQAP